ncbi:MAG: hypothetical protein ACJAS6_000660 [Rickettsiales bacterium]|jgi:hypothetical protein
MRIKNLILIYFLTTILSFGQSSAFDFFSKPEKKDEPGKIVAQEVEKYTIDQIDQSNFTKVAILRGLDKIIARTSKLEILSGDEGRFGKLYIEVKKCWKSPADQRPENKILLKIEEDNKGLRELLFYGWIFSSSPSISGLEHPIYDITAIECVDSKTEIIEDESMNENNEDKDL